MQEDGESWVLARGCRGVGRGDTPEGTWARKVPMSVVRSTSTVGLPRESSTCQPRAPRQGGWMILREQMSPRARTQSLQGIPWGRGRHQCTTGGDQRFDEHGRCVWNRKLAGAVISRSTSPRFTQGCVLEWGVTYRSPLHVSLWRGTTTFPRKIARQAQDGSGGCEAGPRPRGRRSTGCRPTRRAGPCWSRARRSWARGGGRWRRP